MKNRCSDALRLYLEILSPAWLARTVARLGLTVSAKTAVYSSSVVIWLMIMQRLGERGTLAEAVGRVIQGQCGGLRDARQWRGRSARTGGYSRARHRLPMEIANAAVEQLTRSLQAKLAPPSGRPIYLLDGSSIQLPHQPELLKRYPPAQNQYGHMHWPVLRIAVLHDARTGLAVAPAWGPMFGSAAVSEQALAESLLEKLPPEAVVIGDRNFGVFQVAYAAQQRGQTVLFRLMHSRAQRLVAESLRVNQEYRLSWRPTRWERTAHPNLPAEACVEGRLLVYEVAGFREPLYLFTTWDASREEIFQSYGLRWNIETDLRALKQTVRLDRVLVKSQAMLEKELLAAMAAYNLVRTVMSLAVEPLRLHPRDLSFTHALVLVRAFLPTLLRQPESRHTRQELQRLLRVTAQATLPKRRKQRTFPRQVWSRNNRFPTRPLQKEDGK
jgi:hypothetical protein